ncbi:MAG: hypothetical protein IIZ39_08045, partial [Blautia sp.]|nr:hypothetical protein [Blautia sp.]
MARQTRKKRDWVPGLFITWILLVLSGIFILLLSRTRFLPSRYMAILLGTLLLLILVDWILLFRTTARGRFTAGLLLSFVLLLLLAFGILYCSKTTKALSSLM